MEDISRQEYTTHQPWIYYYLFVRFFDKYYVAAIPESRIKFLVAIGHPMHVFQQSEFSYLNR